MSPFVHEPRKRFTAQERAEVFALRDGKCHRCTRKLGPQDSWTLEHVIALENGGTNETFNLSRCDVRLVRADKDGRGPPDGGALSPVLHAARRPEAVSEIEGMAMTVEARGKKS